jgi:hypothetical protein
LVPNAEEPCIEPPLQLDWLGYIQTGEAGELRESLGQTALRSRLRDFTDQTFMPSIIQQLKANNREVPIIGKPSD